MKVNDETQFLLLEDYCVFNIDPKNLDIAKFQILSKQTFLFFEKPRPS